MFRLLVLYRRLSRTLWVRVAGFAVLAFVAVIVAHLVAPWVPQVLRDLVGPEAVIPVLTILASSLLAVSTFSLGIMVSAHQSAAEVASPRVVGLLTEDTSTQNLLALFIGAFVYALTALILFHAGFEGGAVVVLGVTLVVTGAVVLGMIRWIGHITRLGTMGDALDRVEAHTKSALKRFRKKPGFGASVITPETVIVDEAETFYAPESGTLQVIDVAGLSACSPGPVWVLKRPGETVLAGTALARFGAETNVEHLSESFVIGNGRTFEQDPTFGLQILSEISARALSPAINDPGTAIEVIERLERLLWDWARAEAPDAKGPKYPDVFLPAWSPEDLIEAGFAQTARDGAGTIEVVERLRQALSALSASGDAALAAAAAAKARNAQDHARASLGLLAERARVEQPLDEPERE